MLNEQLLPQKFWCNIIDTSTYILNRILIRAILRKTPYELLRGRKPTLDYFRVFGSKCFILNTKDYLTKFDLKSYEGVFLGYSQNSKAYIILNKPTRKVDELLNLTFNETSQPSKTSPLVDDDLDEDEAIKVTEKKNLENDIEDETLEINEIVNIKESRNHQLENNVNEALTDDCWIVAMQEELNQFIANDVWELVPQPRNMTIIGTKWVFRNKLDGNGIVSRNKARLVAQGNNQQEGIDYDETYSPVSRLESIRPDIMFSVCLCAYFQEAPKTSHLEAVKRIFRYIKGTIHLGLWYPKGTDIETVIYVDSDHARDYVDRKSTSGICTLVGCCLTSWFLKKQTALAISTTEGEYTRNKPKELLPYGVLLTRLFKHVVSVFLELAIDHYISYNRVIHPFAPHYERKIRSDHGKKRPRDLNASSSSTTLNHPSSSHPLDDIVDVNDEESFCSNSSSPSQNVNSSSNVVSRVVQNPPYESQHLNTYLFETLDFQTQQRDDHRKGL
nr:retrovirus-related Pol polyprotein from transposon TNT 1-94 [Tanacetum cinerariifolium]